MNARGATRGQKVAFALAPTALLIAACGYAVGCDGDSRSGEATYGPSKSAAPFDFRVESWQEFVLSRGYALTEDDRAELATGDVPFRLIAKLLAIRDGVVFWDTRVLVMAPSTQERVREMQLNVETYEEFLAGLHGLGIEPSPEQISMGSVGRELHHGMHKASANAAIGGTGGAATGGGSTTASTSGTGGAATGGGSTTASTSGTGGAATGGSSTTMSSSGTGGATTCTGDPTTCGGPTTASSSGTGGAPTASCGMLAAQNGWAKPLCEFNGNNVCSGKGPRTSDCDHCCNASCGQLAALNGWSAALCELNGNKACNGQGPQTSDCDHCCQPPPPCNLVTTITAAATFTYNTTMATRAGPQTSSDNKTMTGLDAGLGTTWSKNTFSHTKNMHLWDDPGASPGSHQYYTNEILMCRTGTSYEIDWWDEPTNITRSFGADSGEQAVIYTITVNPVGAGGACGANWTATVSGLDPSDSVNGQVSAVNNGTGSSLKCAKESEQGLSVYTTITPSTYMELNRPPQTCTPPEWSSSKKFSTIATINFNVMSATASTENSGGAFTLVGDLNVDAKGITATAPTFTGSGNSSAQGNTFTSYLTTSNSTVQGGSGTIAFTHTAHPPTSYSFAASPPSCNTIAGKYSAGFGAFSSNTSRTGSTATGVGGPIGCHSCLLGSINSNVTLRSTLNVSALACSCLAPGTSCTNSCGAAR